MSFRIQCPNCGKTYRFKQRPQVPEIDCRECAAAIAIPRTSSQARPGASSRSPGGQRKKKPDWKEKLRQEQARERRLMLAVGAGMTVAAVLCVGVGVVMVSRWSSSVAREQTLEKLADPTAGAEARRELVAAGSESIPLFLTAVEDGPDPAREQAVVAFGEMGTAAAPAVPDLRELLAHDRSEVRASAAKALEQIGDPAGEAVPDLKQLMADSSANVRAAALNALRRLTSTESWGPSLVRLVQDNPSLLDPAITEVLGAVGPPAKPLLPKLIDRLRDDDFRLAAAAATAVGQIAPESDDVFLALKTLVEHPDKPLQVRRAAVAGIGECGRRAVPVLCAAMEDARVLEHSAKELGEIGDKSAIPALLKALPRIEDLAREGRAHAIRSAIGSSARVTRSTVDSSGAVLNSRSYGQTSSPADIQMRLMAPKSNDPMIRNLNSADDLAQLRRDTVRWALSQLGVDGDEAIAAAQQAVDREETGWDPQSLQEQHRITVPDEERLRMLQFSPNGQFLAGCTANRIWIWRTADGQLQTNLHEQLERIEDLAFSSDSSLLASGGDGGKILVWDVASGALQHTLEYRVGRVFGSVSAITFFDGDSAVGAICSDEIFRSWEVPEGTARPDRDLGAGRSYGQFSADGSLLVAADTTASGNVGGARVMAFPSGRVLYEYRGSRPALSRDGMLIAEIDGPEREWIELHSVADRKELRTLRLSRDPKTGKYDSATAIALRPDGEILVNGGFRGTLRVWHVAEGRQLMQLEPHSRPVTAVAFAPDGAHLASTSLDSTIAIFSLQDEASAPVAEDAASAPIAEEESR